MIWLRRNLFDILDILKFLGIMLLVFMFIHFNTAVANQAQETKAIATSTNRVVKSQGDILKAIKQVTIDTQLTAAQQTAIIICMLQVPVQNRTTNLQAECRKQSTTTQLALPSSTGSPAKTATPVTAQNPPTPTQQGSGTAAQTKSEQPAPTPQPAQPSVVKRVENFLGLPNLKFQ